MQPRFYVIISMFIVLILLLVFLFVFLASWACTNMQREEGYQPVAFSDFVKGVTPAPTPTPTPTPTPDRRRRQSPRRTWWRLPIRSNTASCRISW